MDVDQAQREIENLRDNLSQAQSMIAEQNGTLEYLTATPRPCAVVLHHEKNGKTAFITFEGKTMEVGIHSDVIPILESGDTVSLTNARIEKITSITGISKKYKMEGPMVSVEEIIGNKCNVEWGGSARLVHQGRFDGKISKGDRVICDETCSVVMRNLGKTDDRFKIVKSSGVTWDEIGGLHDAKKDIIESIIEPFEQPDIYKFYGRKPTKGILLFGPPRCGKTLLVKATTTAVGEAFGKKAISSGFIYIKGPEILSKWVGVAEENIRQLFLRTRSHKAKYGFPAILFIDEAEAILSKRGSGVSSDIEKTIVPMFLSEMDGLDDTGAIIILATNRPDMLDPAVVQEGRIDKKIHIGRPDAQSTMDIFKVHTKNLPLGHNIDREQLIEVATKELFCPKKKMYEISFKDSKKRSIYFTFGDICSGGMIAEIVQTSISFAMRRDIENKHKKKQRGVRCEDIKNAVRKAFMQNYHIDHTDDLTEFVAGFRNDVKNVEKVVM